MMNMREFWAGFVCAFTVAAAVVAWFVRETFRDLDNVVIHPREEAW